MSGTDTISKLSNLLPTGTFLAFQAVAPLFTNNGDCGFTEKVMTGILLLLFAIICWVLNFTDSITLPNGSVRYGIVTKSGLYNPQFKNSNIEGVTGYFYMDDKFIVNGFDFVNGVCDLIALGALTLLTPPISTCYYPNISSTIVKTVPILVAIVVGGYFAFAPAPRHGIGFSASVKKPESTTDSTLVESSKGGNTQSLLTPKAGSATGWDQKLTIVSSPGRASV
ncbi:hypothetical protein MPTK1_6g11700 [Marchantia polymorpha subsp. ruderalis]|uniref:Uncharacterized protein n=2 Tax=Marchantia polymorpha TaxID=3197 RepID=A0AAF6BR02_MARPO|nr:hypothetical protein MARPO_0016s0209 [Marchantia polymorpha]BBN14436.1 hypothetical protein Mp_6g11700 [Marchantia polymorpha subsp. ruderalis]|eukprot:PTQ45170.1 hypothetical protein MARPO_0016s0209 [Marchantia polymorpha]